MPLKIFFQEKACIPKERQPYCQQGIWPVVLIVEIKDKKIKKKEL